jgi:hypothetical protein
MTGSGAAVPPDPVRVRFTPTIRLTKSEAFDACQALADADRFLLRAGHDDAARALGDVFELLEQRLTVSCWRRAQARSGSNSSDSELTQ